MMKIASLFSMVVAIALLLPATSASACGEKNKSEAKQTPSAHVVLAVKGLNNAGVAKVTAALKKIDGVYGAWVDTSKSRAVIRYATKKVTIARLVKTIQKLGYRVQIATS